jgi:MoxR-like ATPase
MRSSGHLGRSPLLEAMQEQTVTVAGVEYVSAGISGSGTNPRMDGTYLPEAQLDRFFLKLR